MKGYKAFNKGFTAHGNFRYEIGKAYEITGELKMCANGFHFCENLIDVFGYYPYDERNVVLGEVEAEGKIEQEGTKFCAEKITVVREIPWSEVAAVIKDGNYNSGYRNSGDYNSGNYNSGNCNSGYRNSGDYNSGNYNSGNYNSGNYNSGYYNSGNYNSGNYNSGDYNSGYYNSGYRNSGYRNSGNYNSGNYNSGNCNSGYRNSGDYNSGYYNSGFFNSNTPTVRMFNRDSGMTFDEVNALSIDWGNLDNSREIIEHLPNYDAQIFFEATGIDWREVQHEV